MNVPGIARQPNVVAKVISAREAGRERNALQAARELGFVHVGGKVMLQPAEARAPFKARARRTQPWSEEDPPELRPGKPLVEHRPRRTSRSSRPTAPRQDHTKE